MRTVRTKVYKFDELTDAAKQKAIDWYRNTDTESFAFEQTKEDAEQIGLKIEYLSSREPNAGEFIEGATETAQAIMDQHGDQCETYKTAAAFIKDQIELVEKYSDGQQKNIVAEGNEDEYDSECDELEKEFLQSLLEDYRIMYENQRDYEYSDEYVTEQVRSNEYEFTQDGKIF